MPGNLPSGKKDRPGDPGGRGLTKESGWKRWGVRLLGIPVLAVILLFVDLPSVVVHFSRIRFQPFLLAALLVLPVYLLKSLRWKTLLWIQGVRFGAGQALLSYLAANFIAFITPGRIGEVVKALYVREATGERISRVIPTVVADRIFDVYLLLLVSLGGFVSFSLAGSGLLWAVILTAAGVIGFTVLLFVKAVAMSITAFFLRLNFLQKYRERVMEAVEEYFRSARLLLDRRLGIGLLLTLAAYLALFLAAHLLAVSARLDLNFWQVTFMLSVANTLSFLPISISGIGTRDAFLVLFFIRIGRSAESALVFSALILVTVFLLGGVYGFIAYLIKPLRWRSPGSGNTR